MSSYSGTGTRKDAVLRQLRDEIVNQHLPPGTVLKDAAVAARLGVSITPVREAIAQLAAEGLIDTSPNRTRHVSHVTLKNALDVADVMSLLACAGFEWGMARLTADDLVRLRGTLESFKYNVAQENLREASDDGSEYTRIVILASGNRELQTHLDLVVTRLLRVQALSGDQGIWDLWIDGFEEIQGLLEKGDLPAAGARHRKIYADYREIIAAQPFG
jgi:DNA-binding GntR family transcriptional regulator